MDWYTIFKFLHIVAAVCWVGGGILLLVLGVRATQAKDDNAAIIVIKQTASLSFSWFIPASIATVIFGAVAATLGGWWPEAWVSLGLLGFVATFLTGSFAIKPAAEAVEKLEAQGRRDLALAHGAKLTRVAQFDYVVLFTTIADMVLKPGWSDLITLGVFAVVIVIGAVLFLLPALSMKPATA